MLAYDFPLLDVFWTVTFFFIWGAWLFAAIWSFIDNFRRRDHSGWAKALWALVIIVFPFFGVFIYIVRGRGRSIPSTRARARRRWWRWIEDHACSSRPSSCTRVDRLAARRDAELAVDRDRLRLDGVPGDVQPLADLPEREVGGQQRQEPELGGRQRRRPQRSRPDRVELEPAARRPVPAGRRASGRCWRMSLDLSEDGPGAARVGERDVGPRHLEQRLDRHHRAARS